ncbi:DUF362 domain-containing protein [Fimbriiglobus ruber]|uniref:Iron-sulfur cluster-binding protein n=1 Tax=Fimbriiglobus ruber TaxID=1908690 RepID=A0A225EFH7_9BACT|nr:DUF362 domain-containing protein [Fimbriiglobus ruber]OWK47105.1 Iron-sulfur cluster-binding protein [Fimbriiglobus ruber]
MSDSTSVLDRLTGLTNADGGWGYQPNQPTHLEPTCLSALALGGDAKYADRVTAALRALDVHRLPDGSYRLTRGRPQAAWTTALVLFARAGLGHPPADLKPVADRLLALEGRVVKADPEVDDMLDIDLKLLGWPWAEDTFSWVEPTAWACLALRAAGAGDHPRVSEGLRLLLDRAFDSGGANYGNRVVLGKPTEPIPGPTAVMLLALQGVTDEPRVEAAKGYLRVHGEKTTDVEHLAWIKLALACHANDAATRAALPVLDARLRESLAIETAAGAGLGAGPLRLALAALALDTINRNPFRLTDTPKVAPGAVLGADRPTDWSTLPTGPRRPLTERIASKFRGFLINGLAALKPLPPTSAVHIARAADYDGPLADVLQKQYEHFRAAVPVAGKRVVLKPNLVEYHRNKVINTDPRFVSAVIELFKREGAAEIIVAEGPGHWRNVQFLVNESGLGDVLRHHGVRFVDVNHDEPVKTPNLGRATGLEYLYLSRTIVEADVFVSLPKLKTHHWAGATLSLKNLFGTLPGICYGWPKNELHWRGITNSIVDIACTHTPHLAIVDGIIGMEGDGPLNGTAKPVGALVMGADLVAVDATCCRLMKLPVDRIPTLVLATRKRLGNMREDLIPQLGEPIDALATAFEWPPGIEKQLLPEPQPAGAVGGK